MTRLALLAFLPLFAVGCSTVAAQEVPLAIGPVEADLLETRGALSQAEDQLDQLHAASAADAEALASTTADLQGVESSLITAQRAHRNAQGQLSRAQAEVQRLSAALAASEGQVASLTQSLSGVQATADQVPALQSQLGQARSQLAQVQDELAQARRQEQATLAGIQQLEQENRHLRRDLRGIAPLQHQLQAALGDLGRLEATTFEQGRQVDRLRGRVADFRQQVRDGERTEVRLTEQNQSLKGDNHQLKSAKQRLAQENQRLKQANAQLLAKLRALERGPAPAQQASEPTPAERPGSGRPGNGRPNRGDRGGNGRPAPRVAMK